LEQATVAGDGVSEHEMTKGWGRPFDDPIQVTGRKLVTLRDAGEFIGKLPKKEQDSTVKTRFTRIGHRLALGLFQGLAHACRSSLDDAYG
jgi:hypothetical protein